MTPDVCTEARCHYTRQKLAHTSMTCQTWQYIHTIYQAAFKPFNLVSTVVTFSNHITLVVQSSNLYNNLLDHLIWVHTF